jgi:hypothetical protein
MRPMSALLNRRSLPGFSGPRKPARETRLAGWVGRIRTADSNFRPSERDSKSASPGVVQNIAFARSTGFWEGLAEGVPASA